MENQDTIDTVPGNRNSQSGTDSSGLATPKTSPLQTESKYDSHSESMPQQQTVVATEEQTDRVSHDTRDTTSSEFTDVTDDNDITNEQHEAFEDDTVKKDDSGSPPATSKSIINSFPRKS